MFARVAQAGFASVHGGVRDKQGALYFAEQLAQNGLSYIGNAGIEPDDDMRIITEAQAIAGAQLINYQLSPALHSLAWNIERVQLAISTAHEFGLTPVFETHRGRITQDPLRTQQLLQNALTYVSPSIYPIGWLAVRGPCTIQTCRRPLIR